MSLNLIQPKKTKLPNNYFIEKSVEKFIANNNINLLGNVSERDKLQLAHVLNCRVSDINNVLIKIRQQTGSNPRRKNKKYVDICKSTRLDFTLKCFEEGFHRFSPKQEAKACELIRKAILNKFPKDGASLLTGTPTPFSAAPPTSKYDFLCNDNLAVAEILNLTSEKMQIVVGDLVDKKKSLKKGQIWRSLGSLSNCSIKVGPVDSFHFKEMVEKMALEMKRVEKPLKVVLLNSGIWIWSPSSQRKYKILFPELNKIDVDLNFEKPSIELTKKYDNLHILAMSRGLSLKYSFQFDVLYVHNGIVESLNE